MRHPVSTLGHHSARGLTRWRTAERVCGAELEAKWDSWIWGWVDELYPQPRGGAARSVNRGSRGEDQP